MSVSIVVKTESDTNLTYMYTKIMIIIWRCDIRILIHNCISGTYHKCSTKILNSCSTCTCKGTGVLNYSNNLAE